MKEHPDVRVFALAAFIIEQRRELETRRLELSDVEIGARLHPMFDAVHRLNGTPATTLEGIREKLRVYASEGEHDFCDTAFPSPDECYEIAAENGLEDKAFLFSLVADLMRLAG